MIIAPRSMIYARIAIPSNITISNNIFYNSTVVYPTIPFIDINAPLANMIIDNNTIHTGPLDYFLYLSAKTIMITN
jgi:hypothetical protein